MFVDKWENENFKSEKLISVLQFKTTIIVIIKINC